MKVVTVEDNDDGSANITLDMTDEEQRLLIQYAVVKLLEEYIKKAEAD